MVTFPGEKHLLIQINQLVNKANAAATVAQQEPLHGCGL